VHRSPENLALAFYDFPFEPYAPVRRQLLMLLREVNAVRRRAGFQVLPIEVLPLRRRIVKPFGDDVSFGKGANAACRAELLGARGPGTASVGGAASLTVQLLSELPDESLKLER